MNPLDGIPTDEARVRDARPRARLPLLVGAGADRPAADRAAPRARYFWDYDGKRYLDFSTQLVNVNIGHQHPKLVAAIQEQAGELRTIAPAFANDARSEAARLIAELAPGDLEHGVLHQRRRRGQRERGPDGPAAHRPAQGARGLPQLPRRHGRRDRADRRPAALGTEPGDARRRALLGPVPVPLGVPRDHAGARSASARCSTCATLIMVEGAQHDRRDHPRDRSSAPTASWCRRTATSPGVRAICDEFGIVLIADEVMAGFGRCGEWFAVDHWGVDARPDHLRQGRQLRLRAARRRDHLSDAIAATFDERAVPRRAHLLRPPARLRRRGRLDQHLRGRGHHRARPRASAPT